MTDERINIYLFCNWLNMGAECFRPATGREVLSCRSRFAGHESSVRHVSCAQSHQVIVLSVCFVHRIRQDGDL